jgi:hypothetical protein
MEKISTHLSIRSQDGDSKLDSELTFDTTTAQTDCIDWESNWKHCITKLTIPILLKVLNGTGVVGRQCQNLEDGRYTNCLFVAKGYQC